ncbi:MAG TPA: sigma-70 family RNA polymerase sigma factor [Bacteroidales bacterium]|nr:sigma-70 family RNA polymerase sigma factor [Bacteroidales bacterium]
MFLRLNRKKISQRSWSDMPDEKLVTGYLENGDKELIAVLFERYTHLVYGICLNYLPDTDQCKDAVMEIFESLFHKLAEHKIQNFRNWLYTVTKNHCLMSIRKAGSLNRVKNHIKAEECESEFPAFNDEEELRFSKTQIQSAVNNLNQEQGTCIRLMYIEDKSYREISDITGYGLNEVKSHIQNGKRNLKNYLLRQNGTTEI